MTPDHSPLPEDEPCLCDACLSGVDVDAAQDSISDLDLAKQTFQQLNDEVMRWLFALSYLTVHAQQNTDKPVKLTIGDVDLMVVYLNPPVADEVNPNTDWQAASGEPWLY